MTEAEATGAAILIQEAYPEVFAGLLFISCSTRQNICILMAALGGREARIKMRDWWGIMTGLRFVNRVGECPRSTRRSAGQSTHAAQTR
jgi:hypothetical protein